MAGIFSHLNGAQTNTQQAKPTSTSAVDAASSTKKKASWDNLSANIAAGEKASNPNQKAYDFFLTEEEQAATKVKASSTVEDILDVIDNFNRPLYAVAGAIKGQIKRIKEYNPETDTPKSASDVFKGYGDILTDAKKGLKRETKTTSRDIAMEIAPELIEDIEKKTSWKILGYDALEVSALTPAFFGSDILIDPLTYIPFGGIAGVGKSLVQSGGKGMRKAAAKVLGEELVTGIVNKADDVLYKKIYPMVNIKAQFSKIAKSGGDGFVEADDLVETLMRSKEVADTKAALTGLDVSKVAKKSLFFGKVQRSMDEVDSKTLGKVFMEADDLGTTAFKNLKAHKLGVHVDDVAQFETVERIVDSLKLAENSVDEAAILKELDSVLAGVKGKTAKAITNLLMEERGIKRFSNKIARSERDATIAFAKNKFEVSKSLYSKSVKKIDAQISDINKTLKSDIVLTGKMVTDHVDDVAKSITELGSNYKKFSFSNSENVAGLLSKSLSDIKRKVGGLTKYQSDLTSGIQKFRKSDVPLQKINTLIRNLETDIGRQQIGVISDVGGKLSKQTVSTLKTLNKELRVFQKASVAEMASIKGAVKAGGQLSKEIVSDYSSRLSELLKNRSAITKQFKAESVMKEVAIRKASKYSANAERKYYQVFSKLNSQKFYQKTMQEFMGERNKIFEGVLKDLPEHLVEPAKKLRTVLDDYAVKMSSGADPLLKSFSPLYFPRTVQKELMGEVFNSIPKYQGTGKSMLRKRGFKSTAEFTKYVESQGGKVEDDAIIVLMDYMKKAEVAYARHGMETELLARTGYKLKSDLPREIKESLDYLYQGGTTYNNKFVRGVMSGVSWVTDKTKMALTIANPAFHTRNILGFPFLAMTTAGMKSGLNPLNYADALMIKLGKKGALKVGGKEFSYDMIRKAAEESGYFGAAFTRGDMKTSANVLLSRYGKNPVKRFIGESMKATMHVEDFGRYGALIANLRSGMDMPKALEMARKAMFDYNLINSPVDKALQGVFGFYSFSRRNLPQQIMTMMNDPKQYAITARALDRISNREKLTQDEIDALQPYEKESFKIFGEAIDGVREFSSFGFFPVEEAYITLNAIKSGDLNKMLGSRINPVLGSFLDFYYGKNSFYNQDIGNALPPKYANVIPENLQKALGLTKRTRDKWRGGEIVGKEDVLFGDPDTIFMIRQFPMTSRILTSLVDLADNIQNQKPGKGAARFLGGIRTTELDLDSRKLFKNLKIDAALKKKAKAKGAKEMNIMYVPKSYKQEAQ